MRESRGVFQSQQEACWDWGKAWVEREVITEVNSGRVLNACFLVDLRALRLRRQVPPVSLLPSSRTPPALFVRKVLLSGPGDLPQRRSCSYSCFSSGYYGLPIPWCFSDLHHHQNHWGQVRVKIQISAPRRPTKSESWGDGPGNEYPGSSAHQVVWEVMPCWMIHLLWDMRHPRVVDPALH